MKTILSLFCFVVTIGLMAGCNTPESRIKKNPQAFDHLTPTQQQLVRQGRVSIGFDEEAVKLALGDPDRVYDRTDEHGKSVIWVYVNYRSTDGVILYRGYWHRFWGDPFFPYYMDYPSRDEYDRVRVTFRDGKVVSAVEETK